MWLSEYDEKDARGHMPIDHISIYTKNGASSMRSPVDLPRSESGHVDVKNPITVMIVSRLWEHRLEELVNAEAQIDVYTPRY